MDAAMRDQQDAGIDILSDGEMRRADFFTAEFYRHMTGVQPLPPDRRLGAVGTTSSIASRSSSRSSHPRTGSGRGVPLRRAACGSAA